MQTSSYHIRNFRAGGRRIYYICHTTHMSKGIDSPYTILQPSFDTLQDAVTRLHQLTSNEKEPNHVEP